MSSWDMPSWYDILKTLMAVMVIVNPLGMVPAYLSLTAKAPVTERARIGRVASITSCLVLLISALLGEKILAFFGISIPSFRVGGGILVLLIAIDMLYARHLRTKQTPSEADEAGEREAVAVVPLGIPLLSGPGAISTAILYAQKSDKLSHLIVLCTCIVTVGFVTWTVFRLAEPFRRVLGLTGINVCTRLMGLLLAAIAVEFIAEGLKQIFPFLEGMTQ
jgi:multiple antibiotic resistance protein